MNLRRGLRAFSFVLFIAAAALPGRAASFSAELVDSRGGETRNGTFYFQDDSYRFELVENGQSIVVIWDAPKGVMRVLVPAEKAYYEVGPDEPMAIWGNPFAGYAFFARTKEVRTAGTEAVGGVPCTKQIVFSGEQVFVTAWRAEEFGFPLKVETTLDARTMEIRNIKRGPQDATLFALPADFKQVSTEAQPPEWAAKVPDAPVVNPPFTRTLSAGEIIRMRPQADRQIRLQGTSANGALCAFTAIGFKDGRPLGDPSGNTVNLEADNEVTMTFSDSPAEADDIVVRVREGTPRITVSVVAMSGAESSSGGPALADAAVAPAETLVEAGLSAPSTAAMGSRFEVMWSGPGNPDDFISVARSDQAPGANLSSTRVREGNPLLVWAPSDPGDYEVRYVLARGARILATIPITIRPVTAAVDATGPVKVADWIEVNWEGPGGDNDFISIARAEQSPGASVSQTRVKQGNPARVRAPSDPGDYEVRYVLGRGAKLLAKCPVTVEDVTATVDAPVTALPDADLVVKWTGPGYPEDFIALARPSQAPGARMAATPTRQGNPLKLRVPKETGVFEVRYILGRGNRMLAKVTLTIAAP